MDAAPPAGRSRECDELAAALTAERERSAALLRQCNELAAEIHALRTGTASAWTPSLESDEARQIDYLQQTIRNMERSWFWRARMVWVRVSRWAGKSAR